MCRFNLWVILIILVLSCSQLSGVSPVLIVAGTNKIIKTDTLKENQILYNGRIWRNLYFRVNGNQFLFTNELLPGSLTIGGKSFDHVNLKYDIFKDELLTPSDTGGMLQLNKELVDSFSVSFENKIYRFIRTKGDSLNGPAGYFNVLYIGKTGLFLKYIKKIDKLADEGQSDKFYQFTRLYFVKDNVFFQITGKRDLLKIMSDKKTMVRDFISKNKLNVTEKVPQSFIPVIRFFDSLSQ